MSGMSDMSGMSKIHNLFSSFTLHPSRWYLQVPLLTSPLHTTATNKSYKSDMSKLIFFLHSPSATGLRTDSVLVFFFSKRQYLSNFYLTSETTARFKHYMNESWISKMFHLDSSTPWSVFQAKLAAGPSDFAPDPAGTAWPPIRDVDPAGAERLPDLAGQAFLAEVLRQSHQRLVTFFHDFGWHGRAQRIGRDEDMAAAAIYLASAASDYVVGHTLVVDGGVTHARGYGALP